MKPVCIAIVDAAHARLAQRLRKLRTDRARQHVAAGAWPEWHHDLERAVGEGLRLRRGQCKQHARNACEEASAAQDPHPDPVLAALAAAAQAQVTSGPRYDSKDDLRQCMAMEDQLKADESAVRQKTQAHDQALKQFQQG